jgi:hypothetical protein
MAALPQLLHDITTLGKQQDARYAADAAAGQTPAKSILMALPIGTQVLDLVTGQTGVIVDGRRENIVIPASAKSGN